MTRSSLPSGPAPDPSAAASMSAGLVALAPRFLTAGVYLTAWIAPATLPPGLIRAFVLGLILEFLLIHSYAFLNFVVGAEKGASWGDRLRASLGVVGIGAFYLLMAGAISWATHSTTPVWTFVWLLGCRIFELLLVREESSASAQSRTQSWLRHVLLYLFLAVLTAILPLPALGLSREIVATLDLPGSGAWIDAPQRALAFGALYFGLGAWLDLRARVA
ncbi:MAG: hypothetical protein ABI639_00740 [Thermoanaerobaculia bacterium]